MGGTLHAAPGRRADPGKSATRPARPEVLVTLSSDIGKILTALHQIKIGGSATVSTAIQIAQVRFGAAWTCLVYQIV